MTDNDDTTPAPSATPAADGAEAAETTAVTEVTTDVAEAISEETGEKDGEDITREEEPGYKVFVGNLAFKTTEPELAEHFGKAGKVLKANIITRGTRSLGYGFVALETEDDAKRAVEELNKEMLDGREINVELAKPKAEGDRPAVSRRGRGGRFMRGRGRPRGRSRGRGRGRGWPRRRFANRDDGVDGAVDVNDAAASNGDGADGGEDTNANSGKSARGGGGFRRRSGRGRARGRTGRFSSYRRRSATNTSAAGTAKTGDPSKTSVFVANLLFSVNDDGLKEIFSDYKIKAAHVVRRRGGRSKGFGFVEFEDEAEQTRLLADIDDNDRKFFSADRELVIKAALNYHHEHSADDDEKAGGADDEERQGVAETSAPAEEKEECVPAQ